MSLVPGFSRVRAALRAERPGAEALPEPPPMADSPVPVDVSHLAPCRFCGAMNGRTAEACWQCETSLWAADSAPMAVSRWAEDAPAEVSHLAPCRHCGAMNGLTAESCWSCEVDLVPPDTAGLVTPQDVDVEEAGAVVDPTVTDDEPVNDRFFDSWRDSQAALEDEASVPATDPGLRAPGDARSKYPVLTSTAQDGYAHIADSMSSAAAVRRRRSVYVAIAFTSLLGLLAVLAGRTWFADPVTPPLPSSRALGGNAVALSPRPVTAPATPLPAPTEPADLVRTEPTSAGVPADPAVDQPLGSATLQARVKRSPEGRRGAARPAPAPEAGPTVQDRTKVAPPTAAPLAPCTATVAALGLCSSP